MKKIHTAIATIIFLLTPVLCFPAYRIHLKDGREFATDRYWEDGDQVKFVRFGGEVGIPKDMVREIKQIEALENFSEKEDAEPKASGDEVENRSTEVSESAKSSGKEDQEVEQGTENRNKSGADMPQNAGEGTGVEEKLFKAEEAKKAAFLEEKRKILAEKEHVSFLFREAKKQNDWKRKEQLWNELLSLQKRLSQLRERVVEGHDGNLPSWWDNVK
mgnify:CR=1 FL=1